MRNSSSVEEKKGESIISHLSRIPLLDAMYVFLDFFFYLKCKG